MLEKMAPAYISHIRQSLVWKLIFVVGLTLLVSISIWCWIILRFESRQMMTAAVGEIDRLSHTILLAGHYAMLHNSRGDLAYIIENIGRHGEIANIRIYSKQGDIRFSNLAHEVGQSTNVRAEACRVCHQEDPPLVEVSREKRVRTYFSTDREHVMGLITPIYNEPDCLGQCHVHPPDDHILGALDVVFSLKPMHQQLALYKNGFVLYALITFGLTAGLLGLLLHKRFSRPINDLIRATRRIAQGDYDIRFPVQYSGEMGKLAVAINTMKDDIQIKEQALNAQKREYQRLFESVPCLITVQDRHLRLIKYNREFADRFHPEPGDSCFHAYKNRDEPCDECPVLKTFGDGRYYTSEESGINKDGTPYHWSLRTAPIFNSAGQITAVMEMSVDITKKRRLELDLHKSEEKYRAIFNSVPNPLFLVDRDSLHILECNPSVASVYDYGKDESVGMDFGDLLDVDERQHQIERIRAGRTINRARQLGKNGKVVYTDIRVSPSEFMGSQVLLISTTDVTRKLLAEQQLIQASKMATLGEMATGIAHELNQPLSIIKTASGFLLKKVKKAEPIAAKIMISMTEEIDTQIDRAERIIVHMREFGRKSDVDRQPVQVNHAIERAFEMFSQQLKLRQIQIIKTLQDDLPLILADVNRLEQVFTNLLINARDAIENKCEGQLRVPDEKLLKNIYVRTFSEDQEVVIEVEDTGVGIPESVMPKIFEPFFTTKQVGKGTGLGLSISYGIIKDYDGSIAVKKGGAGGALFTIRFPVAG